MHDQVYLLYREFEATFKHGNRFPHSLSAQFPKVLGHYLGRGPVIHHLVDNASQPHDARYFISRTREHGATYFSYDDVRPDDCNFVRSHDFVSLFHNNFAKARLEACDAGDCFFDLPPMILFDGKIILALPFWNRTREYYDDQVRDLFPYTQIITPDGFDLPDGPRISLTGFCDIPKGNRKYYIKYAGNDVALNWGSKGVYYAASLSGSKCRGLLRRVEADYGKKRYWIIQEAHRYPESISVMTRDKTKVDLESYAKFSGFYGPNGLMGIMVMHKRFHKVHGSPDTALSIVT